MHLLRRFSRPQIAAGAAAAVAILALAIWLVLGLGSTAEPMPSPSEPPSATASPSPSEVPSPSATPEVASCPLNGLPVDEPLAPEAVAIAVQIENHPLARPARGLSNADMVVEAPVEGDTTRFSALYLCRATEGLSGPIRSARYYEVDLWQDLHILPVGFGASGGARSRFAAAGMPYVNGITGAWPWFERYGPRAAPHNLYGDLEALRAAIGQGGAIDQLVAKVGVLRPPFTFDPSVTLPAGRPIAAFEMRTNRTWRFGWTFAASTGLWTRQDMGTTVTDEVTGEPVTTSHIVVQRVEQEVVYGDPDPGGNTRRLQHLVGEGDGTLYSGGEAIALHWSRPTAADATRWTYADTGAPVVLPPGVVWWEIIPIPASLTES